MDDIQENRAVLVDILAPLDFDIIEAENGQEAVEQHLNMNPDLIFLDLMMPVMDGFDTAKQIRTYELGMKTFQPHTPIVAVSANVFQKTQQQGLNAGCDAFIAKPFQVGQVLEALPSHLQVEWIYAELVDQPGEAEGQQIPVDTTALTAALPPEDAKKLYISAVRGDRKQVLQELIEIESSDTQFAPLVTELRALAKSFDLDAIAKRLEKTKNIGRQPAMRARSAEAKL